MAVLKQSIQVAHLADTLLIVGYYNNIVRHNHPVFTLIIFGDIAILL